MGGLTKKEIDQDVKAILDNALRDRASTIHIEDTEKYILLRFRVDKTLIVVNKIPRRNAKLISDFLHWANVDDRSILNETKLDYLGTKLKVNVLPNVYGHKITIEIEHPNKEHKLEDFGLWGENLKELNQTIGDLSGIILISGIDNNFNDSLSNVIKDIIISGGLSVATLKSVNIRELNLALRNNYDAYVITLNSLDEVDLISRESKNSLFILNLTSTTRIDLLNKLKILGFTKPHNHSALKNILHYKLVKKHCSYCREVVNTNYGSLKLVEKALGINTKLSEHEIDKLKTKLVNDLKLSSDQYRESKGCDRCNFTGYLGNYGLFENLRLKLAGNRMSLIKEGETIEIDGLIKALLGLIDLKDIISAD